MSTFTLELTARLESPLDASAIAADRLAKLDARAIAGLEVWYQGNAAKLGDFFAASGAPGDRVVVRGDLARAEGLGRGMAAGELVIEGNAGPETGARLAGGRVLVTGSAGPRAGQEMHGGLLEIRGDAGDGAGCASAGATKGMAGGEIIIRGRSGAETGANLRRGLIVVAGEAGPRTGRAMIAGSVVVLGRTGQDAGLWSKRGSIVALGGIMPPVTYRAACSFRPPHLRLTLTYLRTRHKLPVNDDQIHGLYRRLCGDLADLGRGEILEWTAK